MKTILLGITTAIFTMATFSAIPACNLYFGEEQWRKAMDVGFILMPCFLVMTIVFGIFFLNSAWRVKSDL